MKRYLTAGAIIGALGFSISALAHGSGDANSNAMPMANQGMMGGHHMHGSGHGRGMPGHGSMSYGGMMGHHGGMGPGMMDRGFRRHMMQPYRTDLSTDDARHIMEHRLEWQGYSNLKLGKVEESDDDTIMVEIVTKDDAFVQRLKIDRHTGAMESIE